jgi:glycerol kinase
VLAVDQGTSATKAVAGRRARGDRRARQRARRPRHPRPGWVEQDAEEIWDSVRAAVAACRRPARAERVVAAGFSTQRESLVLWDARAACRLGPLLRWQDQRTRRPARLRAAGAGERAAPQRLPLDPMFSAPKARWLLDRYDPTASAAAPASSASGPSTRGC